MHALVSGLQSLGLWSFTWSVVRGRAHAGGVGVPGATDRAGVGRADAGGYARAKSGALWAGDRAARRRSARRGLGSAPAYAESVRQAIAHRSTGGRATLAAVPRLAACAAAWAADGRRRRAGRGATPTR